VSRRKPDIDLGHDHQLWFFGWHPDRDLNPQYDGMPDVEKSGATVRHRTPTGEECRSAVTFDIAPLNQLRAQGAAWQVESWEPLTISPSLLCHCGDHGFIREGRWVPA
jgi:hypothetical protein